jgi:hypothetical protein
LYALSDILGDQIVDSGEHGEPGVAESFPVEPEDPYGRIPLRGSSSGPDSAGGVERKMQIRLIAARIRDPAKSYSCSLKQL